MIFLPVENQGEEGADDALGQLAKETAAKEQCHHLCSQIDVAPGFIDPIGVECLTMMAK